jgi:hypothetical protein
MMVPGLRKIVWRAHHYRTPLSLAELETETVGAFAEAMSGWRSSLPMGRRHRGVVPGAISACPNIASSQDSPREAEVPQTQFVLDGIANHVG